MKTFGAAILAAGIVTISATAHAAPVPAYTFSTIDYPGAAQTAIFAVNDAGNYVGQFVDPGSEAAPPTHAMFFDGHTLAALSDVDGVLSGSTFSAAFSIDNVGLIAGYYQHDAASQGHGFLFQRWDRKLVPVDFPGATSTQAYGVNDLGCVIGIYVDASGAQHAFLRELDGKYRTADIANPSTTTGDVTFPLSINDEGVTVGENAPPAASAPIIGFVSRPGERSPVRYYNDPLAPTSTSTYLISINNLGTAIGAWVGADGSLNNFFVEAGSLKGAVPFTTPFGPTAQAQTINDLGVIVGVYSDAKGGHGFLALPKL